MKRIQQINIFDIFDFICWADSINNCKCQIKYMMMTNNKFLAIKFHNNFNILWLLCFEVREKLIWLKYTIMQLLEATNSTFTNKVKFLKHLCHLELWKLGPKIIHSSYQLCQGLAATISAKIRMDRKQQYRAKLKI